MVCFGLQITDCRVSVLYDGRQYSEHISRVPVAAAKLTPCARGWRDGHALPIERLGQPTRSPQHNEVTAESLDVGCNKNPNEAIRRKEGHAIGG